MIKKIIHSLIPVLLISCNGITFNQIYPEIRSIIGSDDLLIDKEFIESRRFSFIKLKLGRDISATLTLSNISSDNVFQWISSDREKVYTFNGKIIKIEGTIYDFEVHNFYNFRCSTQENKYNYTISLFEPEAVIDLSTRTYLENQECNELFSSNAIRFSGKNIYSYDSNSLPKETVQKFHPKHPKAEVTFYFK